MSKKLTIERLKELVRYDAETGNFIRIKAVPGSSKGAVLGTLTTRGYMVCMIDGECYRGHALTWFWHHGVFAELLDHINGDRLNNRIDNLRIVSRGGNSRNQKRSSKNKSGYTGVSLNTRSGAWRAKIACAAIGFYRISHHVKKEDAIAARQDMVEECNELLIAAGLEPFTERHGM